MMILAMGEGGDWVGWAGVGKGSIGSWLVDGGAGMRECLNPGVK
jgi:hypothetical protein